VSFYDRCILQHFMIKINMLIAIFDQKLLLFRHGLRFFIF